MDKRDVSTEGSFEEFYSAEFGAVFRAVLLLAGNWAVAEDATQEAFARAFERWRRLEDQPWATGWVMVTALNVVRRHFRRRPEATEEVTKERDLDSVMEIRLALRQLPPRQQEAVLLHYFEDLPLEQVGSAMGCEVGTVKAHLFRARAALGRRIEGRVP